MAPPSLRYDHDHDDEEEQAPFIRGSVLVVPEQQPHQPHAREQRKRGAAAIAVVACVLGALLGVFASSPLPQPNPPQIPPECVTALGGGVMGPGGSIRMTAGRNDSESSSSSSGGCRSALAAYAAWPNGPYYRDVDAAVQAAYGALGIVDNDDDEEGSTPRSTATTPRGVVIFDIDETALSNAPLSASEASSASSSFLFSSAAQLFTSDGARRVNRADSPALEPTLRLYRQLQRQGLAAAFVTGRGEASREETEQNLRAAGYGGQCGGGEGDKDNTSYCYLSLTLRAPGDARPASVYKPEARRAVAKATGLPVAGSVGDQWSDLSGEEGSSSSSYVAIKLPNPFYYIL